MCVKIGHQLCPVCGGLDTNEFFCQYNVPAQCGFLAATRAQALQAPLGDITLQHCKTCGHVWNSSFDPDRLDFDPDYDFSQYYSPTYRAYVESVIERLKSRYDLDGKTALDIGCGKGDFMRMQLLPDSPGLLALILLMLRGRSQMMICRRLRFIRNIMIKAKGRCVPIW